MKYNPIGCTCVNKFGGCYGDKRCHYNGECPAKKFTNADKIRAMSDEELSAFLIQVKCKGAALEACDMFWEDTSYEIEWLKEAPNV